MAGYMWSLATNDIEFFDDAADDPFCIDCLNLIDEGKARFEEDEAYCEYCWDNIFGEG